MDQLEESTLKKPQRKHVRQRKQESDYSSGDEEITHELNTKLDEMRERQKLRTRPRGVSLVGLALGKKLTAEEEVAAKDPFNIKSGGMVNMNALKAGKIKTDDAYDTGIGTQFSAETNKRDEDEEMMKYIEEELDKKKGVQSNDDQQMDMNDSRKYLSPEEAALQALPDHLRQSSIQKSEEMLSNQMLSGIPEVDLGIDAKIKNIEATEEAKQKLIQEQKNKREGPSQFVPTNMAVNFVQHNRFNIDDGTHENRKRRVEMIAKEGMKEKGNKKATDDYHYDKFKKQFRRY